MNDLSKIMLYVPIKNCIYTTRSVCSGTTHNRSISIKFIHNFGYDPFIDVENFRNTIVRHILMSKVYYSFS